MQAGSRAGETGAVKAGTDKGGGKDSNPAGRLRDRREESKSNAEQRAGGIEPYHAKEESPKEYWKAFKDPTEGWLPGMRCP